MRALLPLLMACSAPSMDEAPDRGPAPSPAELAAAEAPAPPPQRPAPPPPVPVAAAPAADAPPPASAPPPPVEPTPPDHLPAPPFTAWTTTAPLTLVGQRGQPTATVRRLGVRVEVLEVGAERLRVTCSGCPGEAAGAEGWIQPGALRAAKAPGGTNGPLEAALRFRAGWAGGRELPEGATNAQLCALLDHGFTLSADQATWSLGDGAATLAWDGRHWRLAALAAPGEIPAWTCRAAGAPPAPPTPEAP